MLPSENREKKSVINRKVIKSAISFYIKMGE